MANHPRAETQVGIPCTVYRGGTSRGVLILRSDLPYPREVIERILCRIFGSPDLRQIDGLGGGTSLTSKAVIVEPARTPGDDVQMTFAQISVDTATVDWGGTCGNMTAAVGPFAIESGLVQPVDPITSVRIHTSNTGKRVVAHVPVKDGLVVSEGDERIPGVPGTGARLALEWIDPGGSRTGRLLPTGCPTDVVRLRDGRLVEVSIVDAANPVAFCDARVFGLSGTELPEELGRRLDVLEALEEVRAVAAELLAIVPSRALATERSPGLPKVAIVSPPAWYRTSADAALDANGHDIQARLMSMQAPHHSYAVSGGICTAAAAAIEGTIVHRVGHASGGTRAPFRIAHPSGVMEVQLETGIGAAGGLSIRSAKIARTARRIMSGLAYVPASMLRDALVADDALAGLHADPSQPVLADD